MARWREFLSPRLAFLGAVPRFFPVSLKGCATDNTVWSAQTDPLGQQNMNSHRSFLHMLAAGALALFLISADARAACEPRVEPVDATAIGKSELRSIVIDPPAGAPVDKNTVLSVDLEYRISDFSPRRFRLTPQFKTHGNGSSKSFDIDGKEPEVRLETPAGRVRLCIPLGHFYAEDALSVLWPLELKLSILKEMDAGRAQEGVVRGEPIKLETADIPAAALERQARTPTKQYYDALESAFNFFTRRSAFYKSCIRRFPAMQPKLTPVYRGWESHHEADIDYVSNLKLEALKEQVGGRTEIAVMILDKTSELYLQTYAQWKDDDLKHACENFVDDVSPKGDDTKLMVADPLEVLRAWHANQKP
jgi:hypothetical protein